MMSKCHLCNVLAASFRRLADSRHNVGVRPSAVSRHEDALRANEDSNLSFVLPRATWLLGRLADGLVPGACAGIRKRVRSGREDCAESGSFAAGCRNKDTSGGGPLIGMVGEVALCLHLVPLSFDAPAEERRNGGGGDPELVKAESWLTIVRKRKLNHSVISR